MTAKIFRTVVVSAAMLGCRHEPPKVPSAASNPTTARPRGTAPDGCPAIHCGWAMNHDGKTGRDATC